MVCSLKAGGRQPCLLGLRKLTYLLLLLKLSSCFALPCSIPFYVELFSYLKGRIAIGRWWIQVDSNTYNEREAVGWFNCLQVAFSSVMASICLQALSPSLNTALSLRG